MNIQWTKVGDRLPTNANSVYVGQPDTPFISCLVWANYPNVVRGGVFEVVRWDTKNKCWFAGDMKKWTLEPPYIITHFCDKINIPQDGIDEVKKLNT